MLFTFSVNLSSYLYHYVQRGCDTTRLLTLSAQTMEQTSRYHDDIRKSLCTSIEGALVPPSISYRQVPQYHKLCFLLIGQKHLLGPNATITRAQMPAG